MAEIPIPSGGAGYAPSGQRPLGVTIIAILNFLGGLLGLIGAVGLIAISGYIPYFGGMYIILGVVLLLTSLLSLIVGWGLWSLKSWAWMLALVVNIINLILNVIGASWLSAIINLIVVLYLNQSDVKAAFR